MKINDKKQEKSKQKNSSIRSGGGGLEELREAREGHTLAKLARGLSGNTRNDWRQ